MLPDLRVPDRLCHLARLRLKEVCEHEHRSVKQANENANDCQKSQKCRHESLQAGSFAKGLPFFALVVKEAMVA
jgi:hypothetical protein